jgi:hypothetical protein
MSFEFDLSNPPPLRRSKPLSNNMFRVESAEPFDPSALGVRRERGYCNREAYYTGAPPPRGCGYAAKQSRYSHQTPQIHTAWDEEQQKLLGNRDGADARSEDTWKLAWSITFCSGVALWIIIVAAVFIVYWRVTASLEGMQNQAAPYFGDAINHTMSILHHMDQSSVGASDMVSSAHLITDQAVPTMQTALNQTAAMITRLEKLAANPVMQISLTGAAAGPVG